MSFFNRIINDVSQLGNAFGQAAQTVGNDVSHIAHAVLPQQQPTPPQSFNPAPMQHINLMAKGATLPNQLQNQTMTAPANQARLNAQKQLGFTPAFAQNVANANPFTLPGGPVKNGNLSNAGASAEYLGQSQPGQMLLTQNGSDPLTVLHEGLHRVWDTNPQQKQQFTQAYDKNVTPAEKQYLQGKLAPYASAQKLMDSGGVYTNDFSKLESLPPDLQNEIHSYLPAGATQSRTSAPLPAGLQSYYKQYYNPTQQAPAQHQSPLDALRRLVHL